jgi:hypothetical protein
MEAGGTIKGKEDKEILKLWYDFDSEGMHSVMEVYLKKENGKLLRGYRRYGCKNRYNLFYIRCKLFG